MSAEPFAVLPAGLEQHSGFWPLAALVLAVGSAVAAGWLATTGRLRKRRRREAKLHSFRVLIDQSNDAIFVIDPETGRFGDVNETACRSLGYGREELLAKNVTDVVDLFGGDEGWRRLQLGIEARASLIWETHHRRKDGSRFPVEISVRLIREAGRSHLIALARDITERKRAEERVRRYRERLRALASELLLAEERERRKIATTLHDGIGQTLALCRMRLAMLEESVGDGVRAEAIREIAGIVDGMIGETRSLTFEISSPILYELGLGPALDWLAEKIEKQHGIPCTFEEDDAPKPMEEEVQVVLYQSARELLFNAVKHAHATRLRLWLDRLGDSIRIRVEDDGVGFDEVVLRSPQEGGFGLFNIRERLRLLEGELRIESTPGKGSRVTMIAPLGRQKRSV